MSQPDRDSTPPDEAAPPPQKNWARLVVPMFIAFYLAIICLPLAAAWKQDLPPRAWQDELSSAIALCAFSGLLIEFLLSGRFRFISNQIGIDTTMRVHQIMARGFAVAVLIHPFLYVTAASNYPLPWDPTRQLSVTFSLAAILPGLIAWLALMVLVLTAIFREQRAGSYESWRLLHGLAAALVAIFGTLHTLEAGRYSQSPFLAWFWILMLGVALFTLLWVYAIKPAWQLGHPYTVRSVRKIADRTWELVVAPQKGSTVPFEAGQFVWLNVGHHPFSLYENPFSIASTPTETGQLSFVIKEAGDFTRRLGDIEPGTIAFVDGPYGNMTLAGHGSIGIALYAGGVGIAPILSIVRHLHEQDDPRPIFLFYGNRTAEQIVYRNELEAMTAKLDLKVEHVLSEPPDAWPGRTGMIDPNVLDETFKDRAPGDWLHIICGPLPMIESIETTLLERHVPTHRIISERFYYD